MTQFLGRCLVFAGVCLVIGASLGTTAWIVCVRRGSLSTCDSPLSSAITAWTGAANMALGVAIQENKSNP